MLLMSMLHPNAKKKPSMQFRSAPLLAPAFIVASLVTYFSTAILKIIFSKCVKKKVLKKIAGKWSSKPTSLKGPKRRKR